MDDLESEFITEEVMSKAGCISSGMINTVDYDQSVNNPPTLNNNDGTIGDGVVNTEDI